MSWFGGDNEEDDYQSSSMNTSNSKNSKGKGGKLNVSQTMVSKSPKAIDILDEDRYSKPNSSQTNKSNGKTNNTSSSAYTVKEEKNATSKKKLNGAKVVQLDDDEPIVPKQSKTRPQNNLNDFENGNYYSNETMNETDLGNKITNLLQELQTNTSKIEQATKKIGTASDTQENRLKSIATIEQAQLQIKQIDEYIHKLKNLPQNINLKFMVEKYQKDSKEALQAFQQTASRLRQKQKDTVVQAKKSVQQMQHEKQSKLSETPTASETQRLLSQQQMKMEIDILDNEIEHNEHIILEREEEIHDIEAALVDLSNVMQGLSQMASEQQEGLDIIDTNLDKTAEHTKTAVQNLKGATKTQKGIRIVLCLILLVAAGIVIAVAILFVLLKFAFKVL